ncbi:hypothetical protein TNCV_491061 [Trichonephila clavipes]|nr:hypothetical protein TNCV_491061 [Trichonephila clavipes]
MVRIEPTKGQRSPVKLTFSRGRSCDVFDWVEPHPSTIHVLKCSSELPKSRAIGTGVDRCSLWHKGHQKTPRRSQNTVAIILLVCL